MAAASQESHLAQGHFRNEDPAPQHGVLFREYRHHDVALDVNKIKHQGALAAAQADFALTVQKQDRRLEDCLRQQDSLLSRALYTHRPGFERPSAALSLHEPREGAHEEKYHKYKEALVEYHVTAKKFEPAVKTQSNIARCLQNREKLEALQAQKVRVEELKAEVINEAAQLNPRYGEHLKITSEEMQKRQVQVFTNLQQTHKNISKQAAAQRKDAADVRMQGIIQMQKQQRQLRQHMELEKDHERLRYARIADRSKEQHRALSLGTPHWTFPRPGTV